jgi:predicted small secreted protein
MLKRRNCAPSALGSFSWLLGLLGAGLLVLSVNGCNTISGMGKDVQAAGTAMTNTAQRAEEEID